MNEIMNVASEDDMLLESVAHTSPQKNQKMYENVVEEQEIPDLRRVAESLHVWFTSAHTNKFIVLNNQVHGVEENWQEIINKAIQDTDTYFFTIKQTSTDKIEVTYITAATRSYRSLQISLTDFIQYIKPVLHEIFVDNKNSIELLNSLYFYILRRDTNSAQNIVIDYLTQNYKYTQVDSPFYI